MATRAMKLIQSAPINLLVVAMSPANVTYPVRPTLESQSQQRNSVEEYNFRSARLP